MIERLERWARQGISMDVTTMILRSEGVPDAEIAAVYDLMLETHDVEVERSVPTLVPVGRNGLPR